MTGPKTMTGGPTPAQPGASEAERVAGGGRGPEGAWEADASAVGEGQTEAETVAGTGSGTGDGGGLPGGAAGAAASASAAGAGNPGEAVGADAPGSAGDGAPAPVIAGAGPVARPGERATVRLRDGGPEEAPRYAPEWLQLREGADAAARAEDLLDALRIRLADRPGRAGGLVVHDLGCGTGSMGRWLAPRLDGAQHWVLHDRDPYLLHFAAVASPRAAADGSHVTVETRRGDVARLTQDALAGASLVTASALLDVLTHEEVVALADACTGTGCPALLTLSVAGRVELTPTDPLDAEIAEAFNAHQRRAGLLGPDAVTVASEVFSERGATVRLHPSAWRLGPEDSALTEQWLRGWVGAAVDQRPE
ncbi:trans-aconitate methyltransferase, partial [Streptomyces sp. NPDC004561]